MFYIKMEFTRPSPGHGYLGFNGIYFMEGEVGSLTLMNPQPTSLAYDSYFAVERDYSAGTYTTASGAIFYTDSVPDGFIVFSSATMPTAVKVASQIDSYHDRRHYYVIESDTAPTGRDDPRWTVINDYDRRPGTLNYNSALDNMCTDLLSAPKELYFDNNVLKYSHEFWVDIANGSDITGDGTESNPFQTISEAIGQRINYMLIRLKGTGDGTYNYYNDAFDFDTAPYMPAFTLLGDNVHEVVLGTSSLDSVQWGGLYGGSIDVVNVQVKVREIFQYCSDMDSIRFWNSYIRGINGYIAAPSTFTKAPEYYNCIFDSVGLVGCLGTGALVYDSVVVGPYDGTLYGNATLTRTWVNEIYYESLIGANAADNDTVKANYNFNADFSLQSGYGSSETGMEFGTYPITATKVYSNYYLIVISGNGYTLVDGTLTQVTTGLPTEQDFLDYGMSMITNLEEVDFAGHDASSVKIEYYSKLMTNQSTLQSDLVTYNNTGIAVANVGMDLRGYISVLGLTVTGAGRFAISVDGTSWKVWDSVGGVWNAIDPLDGTVASAEYLAVAGNTVAELGALTEADIALLGGVELYIATAIAGAETVDQIDLSVSPTGKWVKDQTSAIYVSTSELNFKPSVDGTYKVNYQDN